MKTRSHDFYRQSGNTLFLVLLAVALFAALSYAVTKGGRGRSGDTIREGRLLDLSGVQQYAADLQYAINRMMLLNHCEPEQISFEMPYTVNFYGTQASHQNPNAPANKSCHVFDPAGGGMDLRAVKMQDNDTQPRYPGFVGNWKVVGLGSGKAALIMSYWIGVTQQMATFCRNLYGQMGITIPASGNVEGIDAGVTFVGTYNDADPAGIFGDTLPQQAGFPDGCWTSGADGWGGYYHVLIVR
jgi:hypothetical protein